jgi:hypothetical protein
VAGERGQVAAFERELIHRFKTLQRNQRQREQEHVHPDDIQDARIQASLQQTQRANQRKDPH